jgi:hypothetical protein
MTFVNLQLPITQIAHPSHNLVPLSPQSITSVSELIKCGIHNRTTFTRNHPTSNFFLSHLNDKAIRQLQPITASHEFTATRIYAPPIDDFRAIPTLETPLNEPKNMIVIVVGLPIPRNPIQTKGMMNETRPNNAAPLQSLDHHPPSSLEIQLEPRRRNTANQMVAHIPEPLRTFNQTRLNRISLPSSPTPKTPIAAHFVATIETSNPPNPVLKLLFTLQHQGQFVSPNI